MTTTRDLFAKHRLRCTQQRLAVYDTLRAATCHPTADELLRLVKPKTEKLSLATVYNSLDALCRAGLTRRIPTENGSCRFDADMSAHSHVCFRDTGEIVDVPSSLGDNLLSHVPQSLLEQIESELGVRIDGVSIQLMASSPDEPPTAS